MFMIVNVNHLFAINQHDSRHTHSQSAGNLH